MSDKERKIREINTGVVVAAVTDSFDGFINNVNNMTSHGGAANVAEAGLYYSTDTGKTWYLSTIEDGARAGVPCVSGNGREKHTSARSGMLKISNYTI